MSKINLKSMFDVLKQSLGNEKENGNTGNGLYREILKFEPGNTYQVRLLLTPSAPNESIFHYYTHGWNSLATGKFVTALCPTTFGQTCPIDAYYLNTYRNGTESEKRESAVLSRKEAWMVNVYVISDPTNPENEGKVKILRYGKELDRIIDSALQGDDSKEFGVERVFDLVNGSTLRIKCENKAGDKRDAKKKYTTYTSSKFLSPAPLELSEEKVEEIYNSVHDLKAVNKQTTPAEMQRLLDEHFFRLSTGSPKEEIEDTNDEPPFAMSGPTTASVTSSPAAASTANDSSEDTDESTDEKLKKLLAGL